MTAQEALTKWDAGEPVFTIEMGGLGPGYEQAIQILVWELVRDAEPVSEGMSLSDWGEAAVTRANAGVGGFSGAQVGAAKGVAARFLLRGYEESLAAAPADRRIMVSRTWPRSPSQPSPGAPGSDHDAAKEE
jgi:hypothetical protein